MSHSILFVMHFSPTFALHLRVGCFSEGSGGDLYLIFIIPQYFHVLRRALLIIYNLERKSLLVSSGISVIAGGL